MDLFYPFPVTEMADDDMHHDLIAQPKFGINLTYR